MELVIGARDFNMGLIKSRLITRLSILNEDSSGTYRFVRCELAGTTLAASDALSEFLVEVIFDELQYKWVQRLIQTHYGYFDGVEQEDILAFAQTELTSDRAFMTRASRRLEDYLEKHDELVIDGFVRFRMKDYWAHLQRTVDRAVDSYLMDREYREFIKLLRYFVTLQEPKIDVVNIVLQDDGGFRLLDQDGKTIKTEYLEGFIVEFGSNELDFEDLLISALITVAPREITLHLHSDHHVTETIYNIFEERVSLCSGCDFCLNRADKPEGAKRKG